MHWSDAYVGRRYDSDTYDCGDLARDVAWDRFGLCLEFPAHASRPDRLESEIRALETSFAEKVGTPSDGEPVLLYHRGYAAHIGVAAHINGEWHCLHNLKGMGVVRERMSRLEHCPGGGIAGYYRWKR
ncbi:hypothetical protein NF212_06550 [Parasalinivibrio latis]|uniref:hypothetical protein n=1 Tax=Parasalinivibrio latis TaxID=2952610 RepID=UPI0030E4432B